MTNPEIQADAEAFEAEIDAVPGDKIKPVDIPPVDDGYRDTVKKYMQGKVELAVKDAEKAKRREDAEAFEAEIDAVLSVLPTVETIKRLRPDQPALRLPHVPGVGIAERMKDRPDPESALAQAAYTYLTLHREATRELAAIAGLVADNVKIKTRLLADGIDPASLAGRLRRRAIIMQANLDETRELLYASKEISGDPLLASLSSAKVSG